MTIENRRPLALVILDGWGISEKTEGNAVALAHTPNYDEICFRYPMTNLTASGESVGLADGSAGSAEAGHLNMGAGRIVQTDISRIARSIGSGDFANNPVLQPAMAGAAAAGKPVHLIGLLSDGGVHSSPDTLYALLRVAKAEGVKEVYVHGILDGRDVPPRTADIYVEALEIKMADIGIGRIATLCGRFFAMDSGENWERTARAFTMLAHAEGERASDARTAVRNSFLRGIADEFVAPIVLEKDTGVPVAKVSEGDVVVFFNHRADTMRQLARSLAVPDLGSTSTKPAIEAICLIEYDHSFQLPVAFPPAMEGNGFGEVLANNRVANYRIAGSDRFPHVTNFFNGGADATFYECDLQIDMPGSHHRDAEPEMESFKIADRALQNVNSDEPGVLVINFSASAIAAETGSLERTIEAVQYVDTCLGGIVDKVRSAGGVTIVTASHAGCEEMIDSRGEPNRFTTRNDVPLHIVDDELAMFQLRQGGTLSDVAPTVLGILGIEKPAEMTGSDLRVTS
ncbi:MAG TPA: 2,3-bisphosphoglycerate-independent phosphoglycerate mutase [Pyrinomonadaceae bacterium]|nr:2,3-bisphosphoglycerate-independent phosphoglycerate mutase [Pyrinomonadaceae bacterium]